MAQYQADDRAKVRRQLTERAIQLAMQNKWDEAIGVNRQLLERFPNDVEAINRLGKALMEVGRFSEARGMYSQTLELDPSNSIARKNLSRLSTLKDNEGQAVVVQNQVNPRLFIEETGKTGVTLLANLGSREAVAKLTAGEPVSLRIKGKTLQVVSARDEYLGEVEPRLALRLINLMNGGNLYVAAVTSLTNSNVEVIIRETFQHRSQAGRVSFPTRVGADGGFRSYIRDSVLRYDGDEEDETVDDSDYSGDWEEESEMNPDAEVSLDYEEDRSDKEDDYDPE